MKNELPLELDDDPFDEPVVIEITDIIDLHTIPPKQIKEIVEEYLLQAHVRGFVIVRIIHGKGIGVQREAVRSILSRTEFVTSFYDAPGNLGATIAEINQQPPTVQSSAPPKCRVESPASTSKRETNHFQEKRND